MNRSEFLQAEAEGIARRRSHNIDDSDIDWQEEAMRERERRRRSDEADGYFQPEDE